MQLGHVATINQGDNIHNLKAANAKRKSYNKSRFKVIAIYGICWGYHLEELKENAV